MGMTETELLKLNAKDLLGALNEKENIAILRRDSDILQHVMQSLDNDAVADAFIKNKFAPLAALKAFPMIMMDKFIEYGFNPGNDGILELCSISNSSEMDSMIAQLIRTFTTNKYDAAFARAVMNYAGSENGCVLAETISQLITNSTVALVFLTDLHEQNPMLFIRVALKQTGELRKAAAMLIEDVDIKIVSGEKDTDVFIDALKLLIEQNCTKPFGTYQFPVEELLVLLSKKSSNQKIDDETALRIFSLVTVPPARSYNSDVAIIYRPCYERIAYQNIVQALGPVPSTSVFFRASFNLGRTTVTTQEAFEFLRTSSHSDLLQAVLKSGTEAEVAALIKANTEVLANFFKRSGITPAKLRDSIPDGMDAVAEAIYEITSSEFRRQIAARFPELKASSGKTPIADRHAKLVGFMEQQKGKAFLDGLLEYDEKSPSLEGGLKAFIQRHSQATYKNRYDNLNLRSKFLASLKNEEVAVQLLESGIRMCGGYGSEELSFLSAANAIKQLKCRRINVSDLVSYTYEPELFIKSLDFKDLIDINLYSSKFPATVELTAKLIAAKTLADQPSTKVRIEWKELLRQVALLLTKKECLKYFECSPFAVYDDNTQLVFKAGETFTASDILSAAKSCHRVHAVLEALERIDAKAELQKVCEAIVAPKATAFVELFPKAGNRSSELREAATKILAATNSSLVNIDNLLKKNSSITAIGRHLGQETISMLVEHVPNRRYSIKLNSNKFAITKTNMLALMEKYDLVPGEVIIDTSKDVEQLKIYLELGLEVKSVNLHGLSPNRQTDANLFKKVRAIADTYPELLLSIGRSSILEAAALEGCSGFLRGWSVDEMGIQNLKELEIAHELGIPVSDSVSLAETIVKDSKMLRFAIKNQIRFDNLEIVLSHYYYEDARDNLALAESIGIIVLNTDQAKTREIYRHIFSSGGEILNFEPVALANMTLNERVELVKTLAQKHAPYKKLLSQNLSSDVFILNPPALLEKRILSFANLKENLGFGIPGDLTKDQKDSLADLFIVSGSLISLAAANLKSFLSLANLGEVKFEDIFVISGSTVVASEFAIFLATKYQNLNDQAIQVFRSVLKSPSRNEMISLLKDRDDDTFEMSFLNDAIQSLSQVRAEINKFITITGEETISAEMILDAMAGDAAAAGVLEECMRSESPAALSLRSLSDAVKVQTVTISIARKQSKAGENVNLARVLHDVLGSLYQEVRTIVNTRGEAEKLKMKTGFEKFNEEMKSESFTILSVKDKKPHTLYFASTLGDCQQIGRDHRWCTSYTNSYFESTLEGTAILFNLKREDAIVAQGYIKRQNRSWVMNQLRYDSNASAEHDFNCSEIIAILQTLFKKDKSLAERFSL
jgi:hypothetical protein